MGTGNSRARTGRALACLLGLLAFAGSSAPAALAADPPLTATEAASAVGDNGATLNGKVNPKGATVSICRFEYGTTAAYGAAIACSPASLGSGGFNVAASADLDSLEAGTTYHYRLIASSVNGATQGVDRTFTTTGTPACPNADRRLEQGILAIQLPDCMAFEQVNPPVKGGQRAASPTISADGQRVSFRSLASFAETPGNVNAFSGDRYVATRGEDGWIPQFTVPPAPYTSGWNGVEDITRSLDPSLTRWVVLGSAEAGPQFNLGIAQLFRGGLGGSLEPASPLLDPIDPSVEAFTVREAELQGASADHRLLLLAPGDIKATYLPGDPVPTPNFDKSVYLAQPDPLRNPSIKLLTRDETGPDSGKVWGGRCGGRVGDVGGTEIAPIRRTQGTVSLDGSRVYFSTRPTQPAGPNCDAANKLRIMERSETAGAAEIAHLIPGDGAGECTRIAPSCSTTDGDDFYQGASVDQAKVYLATNRQLADTDLDGSPAECSNSAAVAGCDLYLYDAEAPVGERLTQVSAGEVAPTHPVPGEGAGVYNGTVAISGDGSHVYFAATGVLTADPNPLGKTAAEPPAATPKLYAWNTGSEEVRFVGALDSADPSLWGGKGTFFNNAYPVPATGTDGSGNEIGGRGDILVFQTNAALSANDIDGGFLDTFRYDGSGVSPALVCVSCKPGGPDGEAIATEGRGPATAQLKRAGTAFAEENRWISEDGRTILIRTNQALVPTDVNGTRNDYLWQEGKPTMLPGTDGPVAALSALGVYAPVLSHDGTLVAFGALSKLLPSDVDTNYDVYVIRSGAGFPFPEPQEGCEGEACQGSSQQRPGEQSAASESARSAGNVRSTEGAKRCPKGKRKATKNGKTRCVKKKPAKKKKGAAKQRAKHNQGGQK